MCTSCSRLYIIISLLTCRTDFNLARMLHRRPYASGRCQWRSRLDSTPGPPRTFRALLGIDEHFTRGDKILATSMFCYFMGWFLVFVVISIWNMIHIWPDERWAAYWFYAVIVLPIVLRNHHQHLVHTIGGIRDPVQTFPAALRVCHSRTSRTQTAPSKARRRSVCRLFRSAGRETRGGRIYWNKTLKAQKRGK